MVHQAKLPGWTKSTGLSTWVQPSRLPSRQGCRLGCSGGNSPAWPKLAQIFKFKLEFEICFLLWNFLKTSLGLNRVIRTPIFENSDSISRIFLRRTQWHSPFILIQILELNSASIYVITGYWKYGLLHSPLLKGFRPRNLQVRKNVSYHPTSIYSKHHPRAIIVLTRF